MKDQKGTSALITQRWGQKSCVQQRKLRYEPTLPKRRGALSAGKTDFCYEFFEREYKGQFHARIKIALPS